MAALHGAGALPMVEGLGAKERHPGGDNVRWTGRLNPHPCHRSRERNDGRKHLSQVRCRMTIVERRKCGGRFTPPGLTRSVGVWPDLRPVTHRKGGTKFPVVEKTLCTF